MFIPESLQRTFYPSIHFHQYNIYNLKKKKKHKSHFWHRWSRQIESFHSFRFEKNLWRIYWWEKINLVPNMATWKKKALTSRTRIFFPSNILIVSSIQIKILLFPFRCIMRYLCFYCMRPPTFMFLYLHAICIRYGGIFRQIYMIDLSR